LWVNNGNAARSMRLLCELDHFQYAAILIKALGRPSRILSSIEGSVIALPLSCDAEGKPDRRQLSRHHLGPFNKRAQITRGATGIRICNDQGISAIAG
jgi:hypothetical protein